MAKVLIVDDEKHIRLLYSEELKEEGYECDVVRLAAGALGGEGFIVSSFLPGAIAKAGQCRAGVRTGFIFNEAGARIHTHR